MGKAGPLSCTTYFQDSTDWISYYANKSRGDSVSLVPKSINNTVTHQSDCKRSDTKDLLNETSKNKNELKLTTKRVRPIRSV